MNKRSVLLILLESVFLVVFNTVFFVAGGFSHPLSVWLAYSFIHFSYLMVVATPFLVRNSSSSAIFGASIFSISAAYFYVEFAVGVIFILLKQESIKASLIVQIVIAGIYAVVLLLNLLANENTADSVARHEAEVFYVKNAASRVKLLIGKMSDKKVDKEVEKAYDALHGSPSKSTDAVKDTEKVIMDKIGELEKAVSANDPQGVQSAAATIISLVKERNQMLRQAN